LQPFGIQEVGLASWASARSCSRKFSNRLLLLSMPVSATPIAIPKSTNTKPILKTIFDFSFISELSIFTVTFTG